MSYKIECKNIEMESKVINHKTMEGNKPVVNKYWYCHSTEINDYIDECPEKCPYYIKK